MFESIRADLRLLSLLRRAVVAWETMARIMKDRRDEELLALEKRKPKQAEFGTLNVEEVNKNWKLQQAGRFLDDEDEE